ncbi:MAG: toll/interleukin-1 receptor domain-containing protein [Proteobacteria bacterium]|nr:toll/interleukin-1 receptor domain-containing protein [Pseudomonadota bacterium]
MTADATSAARGAPAVFLSYASEDRQAAQALRAALPGLGLEVWYDESDLHGGDAWDQKIRAQIRDCDFFMPVISATTERRAEGYFRREWRLAVERSLDMADDHIFLLPVVIDETVQAGARVPERFLAVQWLRVPGGKPTPALEQLCRKLVSGEASAPQGAPRRPRYQPAMAGAPAAARTTYPPLPVRGTGTTHYYLRLVGWAFHCAWLFFQSWPKWIRILVYLWLVFGILARACSDAHGHRDADDLEELKHIPSTPVPPPAPGPQNPAPLTTPAPQPSTH